jgi:thioesterase domain-containing protein/acyl carrier protein
MVENTSLVNYILSIRKEYGMTSSDSVIQISNIVFDASAEQIFLSLLTGATLYVYDNIFSHNSLDLSEYIEKNKITHLHSVPTLLQQIDFSKITSLKRVVSAGEVCPLNLSDRLNKNIRFYNKYGPTETTISSSIHLVNRSLPDRNIIPIGKPIDNVEIFILDSNNQIVPIGIQGEICIGGKGLARGYLNNPSLTSEKFIRNPNKNGERMYKTGDMGRWLADGNIEYTGRRDFQVKIRGYRIELGEIESVINEFPFIRNTVVIVKEELNGNHNLVAFVQSNQVLNFKELRGHLNEKLPSYMIPSHFIQIDEIPLTSSGKTDRENLKNRILHSNVELNPLDMPTSPEEKLVAKIWSDLLGIEHLNKSDNFFELGGHSLIAIKVIIRLENETGYKLPISSLFEYPTIENIAKLITSKEELNKWKALVPIKPKGNKIPLYLIHGGGLGVLVFNNIANHFDEDQPVYGLQALGMDGKEKPLSSIEEMAAYYINEIMEHNANGPYAIAGHSAGSIVAFEMAKQLTRLNKKVNYLAVFDYDYIEIERQKSLKRKIKRKTIDFVPELIFTIKSLIKRPKKTMKHQIMIWHLRYITMMKRLGFEKKEELEGLYLHINNAKTKFEESLKKYKMEPYGGTIDLFISEDKVYYQDDPEYLGWRPFSTQPINISKVKGDHDKMILPPNDKAFAKILQKRLDSCNFKFKS